MIRKTEDVVTASRPKKLSKRKRQRYIWAYVFLFPQIIMFFVFSLYPIIMSYVYSFYDWSGIGPLDDFVGFANYWQLLTSDRFWASLLNSFYYVAGTTVLSVGFALILAIILNDQRMKGKGFYRTIYFLPVVTTTAIVGIIMSSIFGINGLANAIITGLHLSERPIPFLSDATLAMGILIVVGAWKGLGINMVYWLAGLQSIPNELYESAQLDGAGFWRTLRHITLPLLKPIFAVIMLLSIVGGINAFDLVKTLTNGGPYYQTETLDLFIYNYAFSSDTTGGDTRMGYASAAGVLLGMITFVISLAFGGASFQAELRKFRENRKKGRKKA
ncbi:carbohydrate ABC transporter permease [Aureibacillus halotolerans]|uniref:Carbohydrate ABC transporter membrane protein 1 (CUT1 family) n=1 Tax=Aureibacillus halotolerans TaxID=1508390 RepID=A0A4R6U8E0_9BACI|nr:sugar ABC transporter permease [Aureibacillus halotolerans]TDQ41223.1 carbohydrate ABC transporter membrane protein 1 (CUT1 family) [Aureibacillus halotolerans]